MSSKPTRSLNAVQAARASVVEKVRRNSGAGAKKQGPSGQRPKVQQPKVQQPKVQQPKVQQPKVQRRVGANGSPPPRNRTTPAASKKAAAAAATRSTHVVVARIDPISVLKLSILFYLSLALALFTAGVLLWTAARSVGLVSNIEGLLADVGFTDFRVRTGPLLGASALASVVLVVTGSIANLLMALLYNLLGDVVGGLKVVLLQDRGKAKS